MTAAREFFLLERCRERELGTFLELGRDLRLLDDGAVVVPQTLLVDLASAAFRKLVADDPYVLRRAREE